MERLARDNHCSIVDPFIVNMGTGFLIWSMKPTLNTFYGTRSIVMDPALEFIKRFA
jgi:hypothetical protein